MQILKTKEFDRWLKRLKDRAGRAAIVARLRRIQLHDELVGDVKSVGDGVVELRIDYGPGYRVYALRRGDVWLLLLLGGSKTSQKRDIAKAKQMAARWGERLGK